MSHPYPRNRASETRSPSARLILEMMSMRSSRSDDNWSEISKRLMDSTSSSKKSRRYGRLSAYENMSKIPPANRILPRFVDEIDLRESERPDMLLQIGDGDSVADANRQRIGVHPFRIDDFFGKSLRIGADDRISVAAVAHGIDGIRPHDNALSLLVAIEYRPLVCRRKEEYALLVEQRIEVVHGIGSRIAVLRDDDVETAPAGDPAAAA